MKPTCQAALHLVPLVLPLAQTTSAQPVFAVDPQPLHLAQGFDVASASVMGGPYHKKCPIFGKT